MSQPKRVMFYVQHLLGIGHLARASLVAKALADDGFAVTLVTGGMPVKGFPPPTLRHVELPPLYAGTGGFTDLVDANGEAIDDEFKSRRRDLLLQIFSDIAPDVLITEAFPFGRRQVRFELMPLLDAAHARAKPPLIVASVRDILQQNKKPGRAEAMRDLVQKYYDLVLVHGDENFIAFDETFPHADELAAKIAYSGLVAGEVGKLTGPAYDGVVSAGGGAAGAGILQAARTAIMTSRPRDESWALITGPNLQPAVKAELAHDLPENISLITHRKDFRSLLANSKLSVSQAGYNTVCDCLIAGANMVLVPFAEAGESEQTLRAQKLAALGLAHMVTEDALTAENLAMAMNNALAHPTKNRDQLPLLDGAKKSATLIRARLTS